MEDYFSPLRLNPTRGLRRSDMHGIHSVNNINGIHKSVYSFVDDEVDGHVSP